MPRDPEAPLQYIFDVDGLIAAISHQAHSSKEYHAFSNLVVSNDALRQFFRIKSDLEMPRAVDRSFICADSITRYYYNRIHLNHTPMFVELEAEATREVIEREFITGEVDTVALALLGGVAASESVNIDDLVTLRLASEHEYNNFFNGWNLISTPDLATRVQILGSNAVLEHSQRICRDDLISGSFNFSDYLLAIDVAPLGIRILSRAD